MSDAGVPDIAVPALVGRDAELATLTAALDGGRSLVVIEGEPGIGKTRLVHEALAASSGRTVVHAACLPLVEPFPLGGVVDGLRRLGDRLAEVTLGPVAGALHPLFPEWVDRLPPRLEALDSAGATRHRVYRALTELVARIGVDVLVVDDAHWADTATLEWLLTITASDDVATSVVVTYRPSEIPAESPLLRLTSRPLVGMSRVRITLGPLEVADTGSLVGSMFGADEVSPEFATFLHERTDGVPLAVEECVRLLRDRHDIVRHRGRWTRRVLNEIEVPPTVRDSVLERVARLAPEARRVLDAAAVLVVPEDEDVLIEVAELPAEVGRQAVAAALASGLIREAGAHRYVFRHALDAQAVGEAIPVSRLRRLHSLAAKELRQRRPDAVERLSRHSRRAGDIEAWCHYAEAAADVAVQSGDDRNAVMTLLTVLTTTEHPIERRVRLARKLGEAAFFGTAALGDLADQVVGVLRDVLEDPRLATIDRGELRLLVGRMLWRAGRQRASFDELEAVIPDLGDRPDLACLVMCSLAMPLVPDWPAQRHLRWLDRATELVADVGSSLASVAFTTSKATALLLLGEDAGWQTVADLTPAITDPAEGRRLAGGLLNVAEATLVWGRYADTRRQVEAAAEFQEADHQRLAAIARMLSAHVDWYTGRWDGLDDRVADLATSDETEPHERVQARQILGLLDLVSGARASAERLLREVADEYARLGVAEPVVVLPAAALARLRLADDEPDDALTLTTPLVSMITRKGVWLWLADIAAIHVDALIRTGRTGEASRLVDAFAAGLEHRHAPGPAAALATCRALVTEAAGDREQAADAFATAATAWASLPRPYDELLALEARGRCLIAVGRHDDGLAVLSTTEQRLREMGALWDADRIAHVLRRHGAEVSRVWRRGRRGYGEQLSPREREVLALIARGLTNREVGQLLFLSPRTVGRHLSNAMRKLGVSTRTAAAMAAVEAGLIPADSGTPTH